jgi:hypothetical protein
MWPRYDSCRALLCLWSSRTRRGPGQKRPDRWAPLLQRTSQWTSSTKTQTEQLLANGRAQRAALDNATDTIDTHPVVRLGDASQPCRFCQHRDDNISLGSDGPRVATNGIMQGEQPNCIDSRSTKNERQ